MKVLEQTDTIEDMIGYCCNYMQVSPEDVLGTSKKQEVAAVRKAVSIVGYYYLDYSQSDIARLLGNVPSTIQHHCKMHNIDKHTLDAVRYILNDVTLDEVSILALKVSKNPDDKELRQNLKQLL